LTVAQEGNSRREENWDKVEETDEECLNKVGNPNQYLSREGYSCANNLHERQDQRTQYGKVCEGHGDKELEDFT
jgi:hypothetical protein